MEKAFLVSNGIEITGVQVFPDGSLVFDLEAGPVLPAKALESLESHKKEIVDFLKTCKFRRMDGYDEAV